MVSQIDDAIEIIAAHEIAMQVILTTVCQHDKALAMKIKEGLQEAANYHSESPTKCFLRGLVEHLEQGC
jgi:tRNA threonylcarbamoyladenosine modification (KEOPS) complex Cgi121 subunit